MVQDNRIITLTLVLLLAIFLQTLFVFADTQDTPNKAAVEFARAYFKYDESTLKDRLCEERKKTEDEADVIAEYMHRGVEKAEDSGYSVWFIGEKLYHLKTETTSENFTNATIHLTAVKKAPLRSFFTRHKGDPVSADLTLVKEEGKWKVCGSAFSLIE